MQNRVSLKQKRVKAMMALKQARKTIALLDQQQARENFVNVRRGLVQQVRAWLFLSVHKLVAVCTALYLAKKIKKNYVPLFVFFFAAKIS